MASFLCRSCAHEWPQEKTNKIYHCPECGYGYPEQEQVSNQEQDLQPERLDTLDVLQAIVDAWRHLDRAQRPASTTMGLREFLIRHEGLEKAMEMGRRHLEQEGRL